MLKREEIKKLKETYPEGTAVCLFRMKGEEQMPFGLRGTVRLVDDIGQIHVSWENGSSLPINTEEDEFETVSPKELESEEKCQEPDGEVHGMDGPKQKEGR